MKLAQGNMFAHPASLILVTTNSYVRSNGTLVMGRGAASQLKNYLPNCESIFGHMVQHTTRGHVMARYGICIHPYAQNGVNYGIFQVKYHWGKPAIPELIAHSVSKLTQIAHLYPSISLNYPGIGNGGLSEEAVWPMVYDLPDNVTVWKLL